MENNYQYLDPEEKYTNSKGVLHNLANIKEERVLTAFESFKVTKRLEELYLLNVKIKDSSALLFLHKHLFQDVYVWAGQVRTVNISKDGKPFFDGELFPNAFKFIDSLIVEFYQIDKNNIKEISQKLAEILDNINFLHPFREGNGRTQREFLRVLALEKGFHLNLNPPDNKDIYDRYMKGTINSDILILQELIFELISV
jgi:cell filamentation protein